jgi:hypothetical protein|tara:strand:+ start:87 stop:449 length:363 start_codon:yes stop_codon:yes gene_type:complete
MRDYSNLPTWNELNLLEKDEDYKKAEERLSLCCSKPFVNNNYDRKNYNDAWTCSKCGDYKSNTSVKFYHEVHCDFENLANSRKEALKTRPSQFINRLRNSKEIEEFINPKPNKWIERENK